MGVTVLTLLKFGVKNRHVPVTGTRHRPGTTMPAQMSLWGKHKLHLFSSPSLPLTPNDHAWKSRRLIPLLFYAPHHPNIFIPVDSKHDTTVAKEEVAAACC